MVSRLAVLMMSIGCGGAQEQPAACTVGDVRTCACLDGASGLARCTDASPAIWSSCMCTSTPVASARSQDEPYRTTITVDGSRSSDPGGLPLTFAWTLAGPSGATAQLADPTAAKTTFVPDVVGTYTATLTVDDGVAQASTSVMVEAYDRAPTIAHVDGPGSVETGVAATFDLDQAMDPDGDALDYAWAVTSAPPGSVAQPTPADAQIATFTTDVDGQYVLTATVGDGVLTTSRSFGVTSYHHIAPLAVAPMEAAYSAALDRIAILSSGGLVIVDPATGTGPTVPLAGTRLSMSADGKTAVVVVDHAIALVDVATGTLAKTVPLSFTPLDAILGDTGYLYLATGGGSENYELATGNVTVTQGGGGSSLDVLGPDGKTIIAGADNGFNVFDISAGAATVVDTLYSAVCSPAAFYFASATEVVDRCGDWYTFPPIAKVAQVGEIDLIAAAAVGGDLLALTTPTLHTTLDDTVVRRFANRALTTDTTPLPHFLPADEQSHGSYLFAGPAGVRVIVHGATAWGIVRY